MINEADQREGKEMHTVCNVIESNAITRESTQKVEFCSEIPDVHRKRMRVMVEEEYKDVITMELRHTDHVEHKIEMIAAMLSRIKRYQIPQA